jgi:uncharacterized protein
MKTLLRFVVSAALLALVPAGCGADDNVQTGDEQDLTQSTSRFETFKSDDGKYYFQLIASNGEPLMRSDAYASLSSAKKGTTTAQKNGAVEAQYEVHDTDDGAAYWNLVATNHQLLATSETYVSRSNATRAIQAAIRAVKTASTEAAATGARFETWKGEDGKYYFHLRANNGQIVLQSQGYSSKSSATGGTSSVKTNGVDASHFDISEGVNGQHYFRLLAANHKVIGRSEMYVSKSGAIAGAGRVRDILRAMTGASDASDVAIQAEIEKASSGLWYTSESDYPFGFVSGDLASSGGAINEAVVRKELASYVDQDPAADKPMSKLFAMSKSWQAWKDEGHSCWDPEDPVAAEQCDKMRNLEQVLESNLDDIQVFYFGAHGAPGNVTGIGVSIFLVGKSPSGRMIGVRTLAIWT